MKRALWLVVGFALVGALFVGSRGEGGPETAAQRADRIAHSVRCPTCRGLSAAESDARASIAVRDEILRRVRAGESDDTIRAFLVSRYGEDILLSPPSRGIGAVVWVLPAVAVAGAVALLALAFGRWRRQLSAEPTPEDELLVTRARTT